MIDTFNEKLHTLKEVATRLRVTTQTARLIVKVEPGVLQKKGPKNARSTSLPSRCFGGYIIGWWHNRLTAAPTILSNSEQRCA
jgi:hypothetical protein